MYKQTAVQDGITLWIKDGLINAPQYQDKIEYSYLEGLGENEHVFVDGAGGRLLVESRTACPGSKLVLTQQWIDSVQEEKPPIGLIPRKLHEEQRIKDICEAVIRYASKGQLPDKEWIEELADLVDGLHDAAPTIHDALS